MGGLAQRATKFHQRILSKMDYSRESILNVVPENYPIRTLVNGIFQAWYVKSFMPIMTNYANFL